MQAVAARYLAEFEQQVAAMREALGDEAFPRRVAEGEAMSLDAAVEAALELSVH